MFNKIMTIPLSLFAAVSCISQDKDRNDVNFNKFEAIHITLSRPKTKINSAVVISNIKVTDVRFDTSCIGMMQNVIKDNVTLVDCKKNISLEIRDFFSQLIPVQKSNLNSVELNCFIRKLILTDKIYTDPKTGETTDEKVYNTPEKSGILLTLEFYAFKDGMYIPLYRFDSTFTGEKNVNVAAQDYLEDALTTSLKKFETFNWELTNKNGKRISEVALNEYYLNRFNVPILSQKPIKGLYGSFNEFKNNTPQQIDFTVEATKKSGFLYVKNSKGEDMLVTDLWGYCDGKDMFIFSASNFFKLHRFGNTFRIYGAKDYSSSRVLRLNFRTIDAIIPNSNFSKERTKTKYELIKRLFQIDMESGELF